MSQNMLFRQFNFFVKHWKNFFLSSIVITLGVVLAIIGFTTHPYAHILAYAVIFGGFLQMFQTYTNIRALDYIQYSTASGRVKDCGMLGDTHTFDFQEATGFLGTLNEHTKITISNLKSGQRGSISLYYDGKSQYSITWLGIDSFFSGFAPDCPTDKKKPLVLTVWNDGNIVFADGYVPK